MKLFELCFPRLRTAKARPEGVVSTVGDANHNRLSWRQPWLVPKLTARFILLKVSTRVWLRNWPMPVSILLTWRTSGLFTSSVSKKSWLLITCYQIPPQGRIPHLSRAKLHETAYLLLGTPGLSQVASHTPRYPPRCKDLSKQESLRRHSPANSAAALSRGVGCGRCAPKARSLEGSEAI